MRIITRTIYGSRLQTAQMLNLPYTAVANTTLNEKFGILAGVQPDNNEVPACRYFCIGLGGHRNMMGSDNRPYVSPIQHDPSDAALYDHLPFLLREPTDDLSPTERARYALRKQILVSGVPYIAYYLRRLDLDNVQPTMMHNTVTDGVVSSVPFVPSSANLNPTPPPIPPTGVVTTDGDYLSASALVSLNFTAAEIQELVNVAELLFGNELMAVISEIGLVAGVDKTTTATAAGGGTFNYLEAVACQIVSHITAYYSAAFANNGFDFSLELGATEPLVGITTGP